MSKHTFSIGGVHPHDSKISRECRIEPMPLPDSAFLAVSQHIGAPAKPLVAVGDKVKVGQPIAEPGGFVSAYIHASVSGTVKSIAPRADLAGNKLTLKLGFSHDINYTVPEGIKMTVADGYKITVEGFDKQLVGAVASTIRAFRKPEPYKGKGVRYSDEQVTIKPGKKNA